MADHAPTLRTELYPDIEPFDAGILPLDGLHQMYWEVSGNPNGKPVCVQQRLRRRRRLTRARFSILKAPATFLVS